MAIATLSIDIEAKLAKLQDGMDRAVAVSESGARRLEGVFAAASTALAALAAAAPVAALASIVNHAVDVTGAMKDMQESFGASVEGLSQIRAGAALGGKTIADMEGPLSKLVKSLDEAGDSSSDAARALEALGLNVTDIRQMSPDQAFIAIANATQDYADGAGKAAAMTALFGKEGAKLIPTLNDVAEVGDKYLKITQAQIDAADEFDKQIKRLTATFDDFKVNVGNTVIPVINRIVAEFRDASEAGLGFWATLGQMQGTLDRFESWDTKAAGARKEIDRLRDAIKNLDDWEKIAGVGSDLDAKLQKQQKLLAFYTARSNAGRDAMASALGAGDIGSDKPALGFSGSAPKLAPKAKAAKAEDPLGDFIKDAEARLKPAEDALKRLRDITLDASTANAELTRSERALYDIVNSPEWATMSEPLKDLVRAEADLAVVAEQAAANQKRLNDLLGATDTAQLEKARSDMQLLAAALEEGAISVEQFEEAVAARLGTAADKSVEKLDQLKLAIEGWGRDVSSEIAKTVFEGGASLQSFGKIIDTMAQKIFAMILQQQVMDPLMKGITGAMSGAGGGAAGGGFDFTKLLAMIPSYDVGTPYVPRTGLALIHQGERITTARDNAAGLSGGGITNNFILSGPVDQRTQQQAAALAGASVRRALARNG